MRLSLTLAVFALVVWDGGAAGAAPQNGRFCLKDYHTFTISCRYETLARCRKFAKLQNTTCFPNANAKVRRPMDRAGAR
jgi:hypothetical protein